MGLLTLPDGKLVVLIVLANANRAGKQSQEDTNLSCTSGCSQRLLGNPWLRRLQQSVKRAIPICGLGLGRTLWSHNHNIDLPFRFLVRAPREAALMVS